MFFTFSYGNVTLIRPLLFRRRQVIEFQSVCFVCLTDDPWTILTENFRVARSANNTAWGSDRYVEDGSYLRLKNLNIGYTLLFQVSQRFFVSKHEDLFLCPEFVYGDGIFGDRTLPSARCRMQELQVMTIRHTLYHVHSYLVHKFRFNVI